MMIFAGQHLACVGHVCANLADHNSSHSALLCSLLRVSYEVPAHHAAVAEIRVTRIHKLSFKIATTPSCHP